MDSFCQSSTRLYPAILFRRPRRLLRHAPPAAVSTGLAAWYTAASWNGSRVWADASGNGNDALLTGNNVWAVHNEVGYGAFYGAFYGAGRRQRPL